MTSQTNKPGQSQGSTGKKDEQQQQSSGAKQQPGQSPAQKSSDKAKQSN